MRRVREIILPAAIALVLMAAAVGLLSGCGIPDAVRPGDPAAAPSEERVEASAAPAKTPSVLLSEAVSANKATLAVDGRFPDWIELYNRGGESVLLSELMLRCGDKEARLPTRELAAGEYAAVALGDGAPEEGLTELSLSKDGCAIELLTQDGTLLDRMEIPACESDQSVARREDGTLAVFDWPSLGFANDGAGYDSLQETLVGSSPLRINEVMVYNERLALGQSECFDWVEIKNTGDQTVRLSNYYLSDSFKELQAFRFPDVALKPGDLFLVFCTGQDAVSNDRQASFALNARRDRLYLSSEDGALLDYVPLRRIPNGGSFGRVEDRGGFFFFESPTPGEANGRGFRRVSDTPVALTPDGVFNDVESVEVELRADGEMHYTTDGSVPTLASPRYTGALKLGSTTVLRTVSFEQNCLPSAPLNQSFILNENHTLPVVSVMGDPTDLMSRKSGVYYDVEHERETPGAVEFFDEDGGFSIGCGIKLHGATSKRASGKKTLKLCFRSRYDGELNYDLFGSDVREFSSILLRNDTSLMRDVMMHQVAIDCFPEMPSLDHRYAVMYINGQYWGLYSIREAHSAAHYARHYGYDEDSVTIWKGLWDRDSESAKVCTFAITHDLENDEYYDYVSEHLNLDSIIGWCVIEAWCSNFDSSPGNIRYYYSSEDDRMRYGLSDLDLGMFAFPAFEVPFIGASESGVLHSYAYNVVPRKLMSNRRFQLEMARQLSEALHGELSNESMLERIDRIHDELFPEMGRDMVRWCRAKDVESGIALWERKVTELRTYVTRYGGRSKKVVASFRRFATALSNEEFDQFFGDLA